MTQKVTQTQPKHELLGQTFEVVVEKKLTEYVLMDYYVWQTEYSCARCNSHTGEQLSTEVYAKFTNIKTRKVKTLTLKATQKAFDNYYGPNTKLPRAPLVINKVIRNIPWCETCAGDHFGEDLSISPALPTVATHRVPVQVAEQERKRKSKSRSIHAKKAPVKAPAPMSDADFFGAIK